MQEEVNQKTVALSIRTTKLTGKVLAAALGKVVRVLQKHHRKALTPQGRQSVKKLMNHYGGKSTMPYVGAPKDFDRIAKEFHVDYAFHKVSPGHYLLFFKANQADAITAAFQKYSAKVLNKEQDKASILGQLRKFTEQIRTQAKDCLLYTSAWRFCRHSGSSAFLHSGVPAGSAPSGGAFAAPALPSQERQPALFP